MSESCSKDSALASILRNTEHGFFCRLLTSAFSLALANSADSACSISATTPRFFSEVSARRWVTVR